MDVDTLALMAVAVAAIGLAGYVIAYRVWSRDDRRPGRHTGIR